MITLSKPLDTRSHIFLGSMTVTMCILFMILYLLDTLILNHEYDGSTKQMMIIPVV